MSFSFHLSHPTLAYMLSLIFVSSNVTIPSPSCNAYSIRIINIIITILIGIQFFFSVMSRSSPTPQTWFAVPLFPTLIIPYNLIGTYHSRLPARHSPFANPQRPYGTTTKIAPSLSLAIPLLCVTEKNGQTYIYPGLQQGHATTSIYCNPPYLARLQKTTPRI